MAFILNDNAYYTGLTNLALYIAMYTTNRSDKTKQTIDAFTSEPLDYGDTKVFRSLPFPDVYDYSSTSSLLGNYTPSFTPTGENDPVNVIEETLTIDNFKVIKNTYNARMLEMAIKSSYGAGEFIAVVLGNIEAAKNDYLYDLIVNKLFTSTYGYTEEVELLDLTDLTSPTEIKAGKTLNQETITLAIQNAIDSMTHFSTDYNKYGLKQALNLSDMRLVMMQPYQNEGVVHLMAELLNSKYINEKFPRPELITIPYKKASEASDYDADVIGILMHKDAIQLFFKLVYMGEFYDPSTLNINNFLHMWFSLGQVEQLPSCIFKVKATEGE